MTLDKILHHAFSDGNRIRRKCWREGDYYVVVNNCCQINGREGYRPTMFSISPARERQEVCLIQEEIFADDWETYGRDREFLQRREELKMSGYRISEKKNGYYHILKDGLPVAFMQDGVMRVKRFKTKLGARNAINKFKDLEYISMLKEEDNGV